MSEDRKNSSEGAAAEVDGEASAQQPPDYRVGYGRPPEHSRFKPGQSGNPGGRRKRPIGLREMIGQAGRQRRQMRGPNGELVEKSLFEQGVDAHLIKFAKGDTATFRALLPVLEEIPVAFGEMTEEEMIKADVENFTDDDRLALGRAMRELEQYYDPNAMIDDPDEGGAHKKDGPGET